MARWRLPAPLPHQTHTALRGCPHRLARKSAQSTSPPLRAGGGNQDNECRAFPHPARSGGGGGCRRSRQTVGAAAVESSGFTLTATQHISGGPNDNLPNAFSALEKIRRKVIRPPPHPMDTAPATSRRRRVMTVARWRGHAIHRRGAQRKRALSAGPGGDGNPRERPGEIPGMYPRLVQGRSFLPARRTASAVRPGERAGRLPEEGPNDRMRGGGEPSLSFAPTRPPEAIPASAQPASSRTADAGPIEKPRPMFEIEAATSTTGHPGVSAAHP